MSPASTSFHQPVKLHAATGSIEGELIIPDAAAGIVVFAHGSGSSRHSPRNRLVADALHERGLGTLLIDLLTKHEEEVDSHTAEHRFNIPLLAERLLLATEWLATDRHSWHLPIGFFGASTGGGAALVAAACRHGIAAVVSRGGRPDLAEEHLPLVRAATLLIVGELDYQVIRLNREAFDRLRRTREKDLQIVPDATHLFEEPGALEQVARLAGDWFLRHFQAESDLTHQSGQGE